MSSSFVAVPGSEPQRGVSRWSKLLVLSTEIYHTHTNRGFLVKLIWWLCLLQMKNRDRLTFTYYIYKHRGNITIIPHSLNVDEAKGGPGSVMPVMRRCGPRRLSGRSTHWRRRATKNRMVGYDIEKLNPN